MADSLKKSGQAGASKADGIEITPEMIEAGALIVSALLEGRGATHFAYESAKTEAARIYAAMAAHAPKRSL